MSSHGNTHTDILVAGAFAALSIDLLVYPLDTIKTRIQAPDFRRLYTNPQTGAVQRSLYRGLYQGVGSVVLATVPSSGAFFTTYEATKSALYRLNSHLSVSTSLPTPLLHATASSLAEAISCLILTPAEVLKQNAQIIKKSTRSSPTQLIDLSATRAAWAKFRRPGQLWAGYTALLGRNLPFTAMQFPLFEWIKGSLLDLRRRKGEDRARRDSERDRKDGNEDIGKGKHEEVREWKVSLWDRAVATGTAAATSGSMAAVVTTPIDVVKTRIMLAAGENPDDLLGSSTSERKEGSGKNGTRRGENNKSVRGVEAEKALRRAEGKGALAVGRRVWTEEGIRGLFRGGALRGAWTALGSGLYLSVYEGGRQYLEERRAKAEDRGG